MAEYVQDEGQALQTLGTATSPTGTGFRDQFRWNEDHTGLVKIGTVNQQEKIDAAAKGMSAGEQIARILRGDYSCFMPGDGVTGDITGNFDKTSGEVVHEMIKPIQNATRVAQENGKSLEELETMLAQVQAQLEAKKKEEALKAEGEQNA